MLNYLIRIQIKVHVYMIFFLMTTKVFLQAIKVRRS